MTEKNQNQPRLVPKAGDEDFVTFRENGIYYVDKTQYLKPLFAGTDSRFLLLRPRRFGKTLTMSTLRRFLEMDYRNPGDTSRQQELFRGLKVTEDREFCEEHMGRYPVVSLSLKGVKGTGFVEAYRSLAGTISKLAQDFRWLDGPELEEDERDFLNMLIKYKYLRDPACIDYVGQSLSFLCRLLRKRFSNGRKPVLLVDEYDVPLQKAAVGGYYEPMSELIGSLLGDVLKTNDDICKGILTGCLRATKEGIFTGLNNLSIDTVLTRRSSLCTAIGFTPAEVRTMFDYYGLGKFYEKAREWYDGYCIGGEDLFCPWDVASYVEALSDDADPDTLEPESYWNNSSNTPVIREHMPHLNSDDADRMEVLLAGGNIEAEVDEGMSYGTISMNNLSSSQFWNILLYTGYLTLAKRGSRRTHELRIPNEEVRSCFRYNISDYYKGTDSGEYAALARKLIDQILAGDSDNVTESLQDLLEVFVSVRDSATRAPHENFYHGFLSGLFAAAGDNIKNYKSQAEAGSGYADITFSSRNKTEAVVIEIKYTSDHGTDLSDLADRAVEQIEEKKYAKALCRGKTRRVVECGIAFRGRECEAACKELLSDGAEA